VSVPAKRKLKRSPASLPLQHCRSCGSRCKSLCRSQTLVANHCTLNRELMRCVLAPAFYTSSLAERSRRTSRRSHGGFNSTWPHRRSDLDSRLFLGTSNSHNVVGCPSRTVSFFTSSAVLFSFPTFRVSCFPLRPVTEAIRHTSAPLPSFRRT
jgi:hypothetical protein